MLDSLSNLMDVVTLRIALYACAALLILSVVLGTWLYVVTLQRDKARADIAGWSAVAQLQNQAVEQWKEKADAQELRAAGAEKEAARVRTESRKRAADYLKAPVPADCTDAVQWGAIEAAKLAELWEAPK